MITETAYFACGCFWGTQYHMDRVPGVIATTSGYMGGELTMPTYSDVCSKKSGHLETVQVLFDPQTVSYETLLRLFFEIHDFTQQDGQGPDIGPQYLSAIFYTSPEQKQMAEHYVDLLKSKGYEFVTQIRPAEHFWAGESYHQHYYDKNGSSPYCHIRRKIF